MSGLYRRALEIASRRPQLRVLKPHELHDGTEGDDGISAEERAEITERINAVVAANRIRAEGVDRTIRPRRRGGVFVLLVNLIAAVLITVGILIVVRLFESQEAELVAERRSIASVEGELMQALQEEADAQLSAKDSEIADIQTRLSEVSAERRRLVEETENIIAAREAQLRAELAERLELERAQLQSEGLSAAEIETRLQEVEAQQEAQLADSLAVARSEAEARLAEQEAQFAAEAAAYRSQLDQAAAERQALEERYAAEARALNDRLEAESEQLEAERRALSEELDREVARIRGDLQTRIEELDAERDQTLARVAALEAERAEDRAAREALAELYETVEARIAVEDYEGARVTLSTIRRRVAGGDLSEVPAIAARRDTEVFLVDALDDLLDLQIAESSVERQAMVATAALVRSAADLVRQGDARLAAGSTQEASRLYRSALEEMPPAADALARLDQIAARAREVEAQEVAVAIETAAEAARAGDYQQAANRYRELMSLLIPDNAGVVSTILDVGYQLRAAVDRVAEAEAREAAQARISQLEAGIAALQDRIADLEQDVEARDRTIENQLQAVAAGERGIDERDRVISGLRSQVEGLEAEVADLQGRLNDTEAALTVAIRRGDESATALGAMEDEHRRLSSVIAEYRSRYGAAGGEDGEAGIEARSTTELLETKLLLLRVLSSAPVRSEYPSLYSETQDYLDALVAEEREAAEMEVLTSMNRVLDSILAAEGTPDIESGDVSATGAGAAARRLFDEFLGKLERLVTLP